MSEVTIIEKEFKILLVNKKNKNHRAYTDSVVNPWIEDDLNKSENHNEGFDLEFAIDGEEERDIYHEFTMGALSCGVINRLRVEDGVLYGVARFKLPSSCSDLTKKVYDETLDLRTLAVVPKGKGSVKNQTVQDDFELYGFNLILAEDSSFDFDKKEKEEEEETEEA